MPCADHVAKRERARELRRQGCSRAQIAREIQIKNMKTIDRWISNLPIPAWTRRPNAKDELKAAAIAMRQAGETYDEIRAALGVSKSSLSLWLRDLYLTDDQRKVLSNKHATAPQRRGASNRARRAAKRAAISQRAAREIGVVTEREAFLVGAILYWAEGAKAKPWRPSQCVDFINSDPRLIRLFLAWLEVIGVAADRLSFRISIHESADLPEAERYWRALVGLSEARFLRAQLKKHNLTSNRRNRGADYHGCLIIRVTRSTELYRRIEGWVEGIVMALGPSVNVASTRSFEVRGSGSTPGGPAKNQFTLFEPSPPYRCQRAG